MIAESNYTVALSVDSKNSVFKTCFRFQCITEYGTCPPPAHHAECCDINTSGPTVNQVGGISNIFQLYQILHIIKTRTNTHSHGLIHPHPLTSKVNTAHILQPPTESTMQMCPLATSMLYPYHFMLWVAADGSMTIW